MGGISAIDELGVGASPSRECLSAEFFRAFNMEVAVFLCEARVESYEIRVLPQTFK